MADFLTSQLDYVYFVYGLALMLLGAVAGSIPRGGTGRLPWGWLAAFGWLHGSAEWLHLARLAGGNSPFLEPFVTLLLLASYACLLGFARRSHVALRGSGPDRWFTGVLVALPISAALVWGLPVLAPAMRLLLALPATLWSAAALVAASRRAQREGKEGGTSLSWAAAFLAAYGLAAGIVVPGTPGLPRGWPTIDAFLAATGIPVQLVRAAAVSGAAFALWAHATSADTQGRVVRKRWRLFSGTAATLLLVIAGGWVFTDQLGRQHDRDLQADAEVTAAQVQDHLVMEMEGASDAARMAVRFISAFDLIPAIARGGSPQLDEVVDAVAGPGGEHVAFLLDAGGTVIATSRRGDAGGYAGRNLADRPYFLDARGGAPGRFVGIGRASGTPGFYASEPILDAGGNVVGAAVVRQRLSAESFGPLGTGTSFLVGSDGRVLVTGVDVYQGRRMWPALAGPEGAGGGQAPLVAASWAGTGWVRVDGARHVAVRIGLPALDWSVVTIRKESLRGPNRLLGIVITLLLSLVIVASFVIAQRQLGTESRLAQKQKEAEGRAREMARRADTDVLTGVANRQGFNEVMSREFARARRFRHPLSIVILDLDHFKRVNDQHGHPAGDQVLVATARLLSTRVRESDLVARWGGEEFAVIASVTDAAGAARLAEKLRALMEVTHLGPAGDVTGSFGVSEMRPDDTVESMLERADEALYAAKAGGRNQVRCGEAWVDMAVVASPDAEGGGEAARSIYMETGFSPVDGEHQEIGGAIREFVSLVDAGDADVVRPAMANLIASIADHFAHEEELMRGRNYPSRARHEEAHMLFVGDARRFRAELERSGVTPGFRQWASSRLPDWFRYHILAHDVALGKFLLEAAGSGPPGNPKRQGAPT
jgi:diguanylate cyclase (GGDEF)-like protein/hemerythrin-like metal-binding protein